MFGGGETMKRKDGLLGKLLKKIEELYPMVEEIDAYGELHENDSIVNVYVGRFRNNPTITVRGGKAYIEIGYVKTVRLLLDERYAKDFVNFIEKIRTSEE